ncbi:hypothetical protein D1007_52993 [Hordeum vulgare]|nr:hypothetical protein D1007_52993 [Hordeum vulgare]
MPYRLSALSCFVASRVGRVVPLCQPCREDSDSQTEVNNENKGAWSHVASGPVYRGCQVYLLENTYAIMKRGMVFITYEVREVMSYDVNKGCFSLVDLPENFNANADKEGSDYKISSCNLDTLCIVQIQGVDLHIWDRD